MRTPLGFRIPALILLAGVLAHAQVELAPLDCGQEPGLRSQNSANSASIEFINATGQPVKTYWRDFNGQRVFYQDLPAGTSYQQPTFLTHPWVVTDASDRCLAIFMPIAGSATARIGSTALRLSLSATSVAGGASVSGTVTLNAPAGGGGVTVSLASNNPAAQPPAGVIVQPGLLSANFTIPTIAVTTTQTALITATRQSDTAVASLSITAPVVAPQLSPSSLTFSAIAGSEVPVPQSISFLPGPQFQLAFSASVDNGSDGSPAPPWISAQPASGVAPANISVSVNPAGLQPGTYTARVVVSHGTGNRLTAPVTLVLQPSTLQALDVSPANLSFFGTAAGLAGSAQSLFVRNLGAGGPISFRATVTGQTSWLTVSPITGQTSAAGPVAVEVRLNTQTLDPGVYVAEIKVESGAMSAVIPVSLLVVSAGPVIQLDQTGFLLQASAGQGNFNPRQIAVLNPGSGVANWTVEVLAGADWLGVQPRSGQATAAVPGLINFNLNAGSLAPGVYYALVRVSDPAALNGPQYITGVLNMTAAGAPPAPEPAPAGLFFTTAGPAPPS